jgi:hypothetical protein
MLTKLRWLHDKKGEAKFASPFSASTVPKGFIAVAQNLNEP